MAARRAAICKRYLFQQIENQHVVGHSIERWGDFVICEGGGGSNLGLCYSPATTEDFQE